MERGGHHWEQVHSSAFTAGLAPPPGPRTIYLLIFFFSLFFFYCLFFLVGGKKRKQWKWIFREDCVCMNEWWDCKRWSCLVSVFIVLLCFVFYCCFPFFLFLEIGRSALLCFFCGDVLIPVVFFFSDPPPSLSLCSLPRPTLALVLSLSYLFFRLGPFRCLLV